MAIIDDHMVGTASVATYQLYASLALTVLERIALRDADDPRARPVSETDRARLQDVQSLLTLSARGAELTGLDATTGVIGEEDRTLDDKLQAHAVISQLTDLMDTSYTEFVEN